MTEPTDAEIWQMWMPMVRRMGVADPVEFARAVLAKWGTPAVAGEPDYATFALWYADHIGDENKPVRDAALATYEAFATPQPTQAQAGAVPLTCEWAHNEDDGFWDTECGQSWRFDDGGPKENHMNFCHCCGKPLRIKGGQHGAE